MPELRDIEITVICDVTNPLLGENGATFVYGPQKGAVPAIRDELEAGMARYARVAGEAAGKDIASFPGAGAAGGLGAALGGVLGAKMKSGIDAVLDAADFDRKLEGASLVVTGEGRIDGQSVRFGKAPAGVAKRCAARGIPTAAIAGGIGDGAEGLFDLCESTIQATEGNFTNYTFGEQADEPGFYPIDDTATLLAQTAYMQLPTGFVVAGVKVSVVFEEDIIDGIEEFRISEQDATIYDLAGRRLGKTQRGINIVGGKKVLIK